MDKITENQKSNLRQKLLTIGKGIRTFAVSEESESKKAGTKDSKYRFTPGYIIVEELREQLDAQNIKLEPNCESESHEMITYPVYKLVNGNIVPFEKKEMYVTLTVNYTFVDTETGETLGPFRQISAGANGTDKSIASALSLAERYFLLKYFQITTHEPEEEPDLHDSETLPGIAKNEQPISAPESNGKGVQRMNQRQATQNPVSAPQTYMPNGPATTMQKTPEQNYNAAVEALMYFNEGTESHNRALNYWLTQLRMSGYDTSDPAFVKNLTMTAQSRRLGQA